MFQCAGPMGSWQLDGNTSTDFLDLGHWITMARRCEEPFFWVVRRPV